MRRIIFISLVFLITCLSFHRQCPAQVLEHVVIYKKAGVYACFPSLFKVTDGTLVLTFGTRSFTSHYDGEGGSETLVSKDQGRTWNPPTRNYFNPVHWQPDGRIAIPSVNGWRRVPQAAALKLRDEGIQVNQENGNYFYAVGAYLETSYNNGCFWHKRQLHLPSHALLMGYNVSSRLKTQSGVSLYAVYGKLTPNQNYRVFFLRSGDTGKTWNFLRMATGFGETALAQTDTGQIVAMMRPVPDSIGYLSSSISSDEGLTWSAPQKTSIWGYPANLLFVDGKLICTYGYRKAPMGVRISVFTDNNFTTPSGSEVILRSDATGSPGNVGYPVTVSLGNGEFFTVYYITLPDGITHVAGTRWKL